MQTGEIIELSATLGGTASALAGASYVGARYARSGVSAAIAKVACSAVVVAAGLGFGIVLFFANPINWRTDMYGMSWPVLSSNGGILALVVEAWFLALRRIWGQRKQSANQPLDTNALSRQ